ncbi:MAG TPA: LptF/LptG family permease [Vicinamibacterales bacterium]|nr:LptF/LptG family permease [Vicinamibacterales bacterium]
MFKTLDRYILREIVFPFTIGLVVLTFVLEIPVILRQAEDLVAKGVEAGTIVRVLMTLLPSQLSLTIPMSLLLGILIGFGRLSADREFVAMQACGVSLMRLLRPLLLVAAVATGFAAYQTIVALPSANQTFREITYNIVASRVERSVRPGVFFEDFGNRVIFVRDLPPTGGWKDVMLADTSQPGQTTVFFAKQGRILLDREKKIVQLELLNGSWHTIYTDNPDKYWDNRFASTIISLDPAKVFPPPPAKGAPEMTFAELETQIASAVEHGDPGNVYRMMYQQKLALPMTCPILAIIGLALGASNRKDGKLASFVLGAAVIFAYYILLYSFRSMAMGGFFSPEWAPWVPNIIMAAVGVWLLTRRARSADQPMRFSLPAFWRRKSAEPMAQPAPPGAVSSAPRRRFDRVFFVIRVPYFSVPQPRLLDRYLARQYWRIAALCVFSLLGLSFIATFIDIADELLRGEVPFSTVVRYFYFLTPQYVFWVIPVAVLIATLVTMSIMTKNSEIIVMRACGISLYRTAVPLIMFGLLASGALFGIQEWLLPISNREADRLDRIVRGYGPQTSPFNQRWIVGRTGTFYHYDLFDSRRSSFVHLWMYDVAAEREGWQLNAMTYSNNVALTRRVSAEESDGAIWTGTQGWARWFARSKQRDGSPTTKYEPFSERELRFESPEYFASRPTDTVNMTYDQMLSFNQLRDYIAQLKQSGSNALPYVVRLHRKVAFPLVTVVMTLLAVPFAVSGGRRGALYGLGMGLVLALAYFVMMSVFGALGSGGVLPPILAAWAPNLLFALFAFYMILTVRT